MSRNSTSGVCVDIACMAWMPSSASAQTTSSGHTVASVSLSSRRSTASSSAITAFNMLIRDLHHRSGGALFDACQLETCIVTVQRLQPLADVSDAVAAGLGDEARSAVGQLEAKAAADDLHGDKQGAHLLRRCQ